MKEGRKGGKMQNANDGPIFDFFALRTKFCLRLFANATSILYCFGILQWMCANAKHIFGNGERKKWVSGRPKIKTTQTKGQTKERISTLKLTHQTINK